MKLLDSKFFPFILGIFLTVIFFWQFFFKGLLPIPADTIVGLYHPYRDFYAKDYPRGIPYKNFLITDPVRQQYPWKNLSIDVLKKGSLPLWNPYSFSGMPLLANFQSAIFYPMNLLFFILPFNTAWGVLISSEVFLGFIFMFFYLNNQKLSKLSSVLGSIVFSFSGFSIAWLEWGNIIHTLLWVPLILLSIDNLLSEKISKKWPIILAMSLVFSFFGGHLQVFFYVFILSLIYFIFRWNQNKRKKDNLFLGLIILGFFLIVTSIQWLPTFQLIMESARNLDQSWQKIGWFIPWQHLVQFIVPDFFGNPATLNYWGVFNYGEFIGYIGVFPLIMSLFALFFRKDRNILLFGSIFFVSLIFALPTPFAKIPYILNLPFLSTSQPTRLLSVTDFSLAVLCAFGFELFLKDKRKILYPFLFLFFIYSLVWFFVINFSGDPAFRENMAVAKSNMIFPTFIFLTSFVLILLSFLKQLKRLSIILPILLILLTAFDLFRFGWKFIPFTKSEYLFPNTKILSFLEGQKGQFRIMATDPRIFSPNFSDVYKIFSVDGYDPLYILRYGELIASSERNNPDINPPFGFDRIITPHNVDSKLIDLLGVKYILSLSDISNNNLTKVYGEGETRVYENRRVLQRTFFVDKTVEAFNRNDSIKLIFSNENNLAKIAIVEGFKNYNWIKGEAQIKKYGENEVLIRTKNNGEGFLVLTDSFYPSWHAKIDGQETEIIRTDFNFRGIVVPGGEHTVLFYINLL